MTAATHANLLADSVRRMLAGAARWSDVVEHGYAGFFSSEHSDSLADLLIVMTEMGRRASMLPVLEAAIANRYAPGLVGAASRLGLAIGTFGLHEHASSLVFARERVQGTARFVEGAAEADEWLVLTDDCFLCVVRRDAEGVTVQPRPALAAGFADLHFSSLARARSLTPAQCTELLTIVRLGRAARAYGAALAGFEAALAYSKQRKQFGKAIGSFQAIQHKMANSHMALEGCRLQLTAAANALDGGAANWRALAASATAFASGHLRKVALETQHCFGAIGFAEVHLAPELFRRVHADVVRLDGVRARAELGECLLAADGASIDGLLDRSDDAVGPFRKRFREWLAKHWSKQESDASRALPECERPWDLFFAKRLGEAGWTGLNWPKAAGGLEATPLEQLAYAEELLKAGATDYPLICSCRIMAPEIIAHGSPLLKQKLLPGLRAGTVTACLGYSEPDAGSDLASLRTRAVRDGDAYLISGQKIWITDGHRASYMLLAARTHPDPELKHAGISLFVVPMSLPGISVHEMQAMSGQKFCSIFFDNVRVPVEWRLGEENAGWSILAAALANERIAMGGLAVRVQVLLKSMVQAVQQRPQLLQDSLTHDRIGQLAAELVTSRLLVAQTLEFGSSGAAPLEQAAMAKVFASELAQTMCETALDLLGSEALLSKGAKDVPADGEIELLLRTTIMFVVGGGSNEIQRNIIAQRGLGLGR